MEIGPCPKCGEELVRLAKELETDSMISSPTAYFCFCSDCDHIGQAERCPEDAILMWNREREVARSEERTAEVSAKVRSSMDASRIRILRPGIPRRDDRKCPECGGKQFEKQYSKPPRTKITKKETWWFRCLACGCIWDEEGA